MKTKGALWFSAHAMLYFATKRRRDQRTFVVYENVYLIRARSASEAKRKAERHAKLEAAANGDVTVENIPAKMMFGAIRKVVACAGDPSKQTPDTVSVIYDGIEATYSRFVVTGRDRLKRLLRGEGTAVVYEE